MSISCRFAASSRSDVHNGFLVGRACENRTMVHRFLTLADVTEVLNISPQQAYALLRSGELPAIQIGVNGQWRIEAEQLEAYIQRMYEQTRARISGREQHSDAAHEV